MDADIRSIWATPIWIGQLDAETLSQVAAYADPGAETNLGLHAERIPAVADLERTAAAALGLNPGHRWRHRLAVWPAGFYCGMTYSHTAIRAMVIVASNQPTQHPDSGVLSLHDPRTGAANVALPGLPWGRTTKIPPLAGGAIATPGWLGCSIAPLRGTHTMTMWTAEATATQQ